VIADHRGLRDEAIEEYGPFVPPEIEEPKPVPEQKAVRAALQQDLLAAGLSGT
jgi:hypothetical protein